MVIETLMFRVLPRVQDEWIEFENTYWLPWLRQQPGFVHKTINVNHALVTHRIWWKSKQALQAASAKKAELNRLTIMQRQRFGATASRLGAGT